MSDLEAAFATLWRQLAHNAPEPELEYRFAPPRRWRFDFAWPAAMVALELEGGTWCAGRHVRGTGYSADCEKYNEAALAGWTVVRLTADMLAEDPARWIAAVAEVVGNNGGGA